MKGDFTRRTFRSGNHYRAVLMQQGRVQLDADWNEQADIQAYLDETTTTDTIGWHGGPLHGAGMAITLSEDDKPFISAGRYYVDGILCENDTGIAVDKQADLPSEPGVTYQNGLHVAYLEVWREHLTALERPELREVALGGPDTTTRSRTIWQVHLQYRESVSCAEVAPPWAPAEKQSTGRMLARTAVTVAGRDPCVVPEAAGYRRLENQLYRVEIHDKKVPSFVWSRDNGSVVARLTDIKTEEKNTLKNTLLTIDLPGRDERLGFAQGHWVEVTNLRRARRGQHGFLGQLTGTAGSVLTVAAWNGGTGPSADLLNDPADPPIVRRWDSPGAVPIVHGLIDLEDGIQIEFEYSGDPATLGDFQAGDYWLIPARTANLRSGAAQSDLVGNVEWPQVDGKPSFQEREGVQHHFAAIAILICDENGKWILISDCRRLFPPLTELIDIEYAGGSGQEAMPGYPLPQPLQVSVSNGINPMVNTPVRFVAEDGNGVLASDSKFKVPDGGGSPVVVETNTDGIASCFWKPKGDGAESQRVTAELPLGTDGGVVGAPVHFTANLSIASQVAFDSAACAAWGGAGTVQAALERLVQASSIVPVGGDGQVGGAGAKLPEPVQVLVRNDCGPVLGASVSFAMVSGKGIVSPSYGALDPPGNATVTIILTNMLGIAKCYWKLGQAGLAQVVTATLVEPGTSEELKKVVAFTANVVQASDVAFSSDACAAWGGAGTVQAALDKLVQARSILPVGGDGQVGGPGAVLPQPVQVLVRNDCGPMQGVPVDFTVESGEGIIGPSPGFSAGQGKNLTNATNSQGISVCYWKLGPIDSVHVVTAKLGNLGTSEQPGKVAFTANVVHAGDVAFKPGTCSVWGGAGTVQAALAKLVQARSIVPVGGDGQDGEPDKILPNQVEVLVRNDCGPVVAASVQFTAKPGAGKVIDASGAEGSTAISKTDSSGFARCSWRLGPTVPVQVVTAELANPIGGELPVKLAFTANLRTPVTKPGLHVKKVTVKDKNTDLPNGGVVNLADLLTKSW